jgi:predicted CXXCH cytochrome family protein
MSVLIRSLALTIFASLLAAAARAQGDGPCLDCHQALVNVRSPHPAAATGLCTACHVENVRDTTARQGRPHRSYAWREGEGAQCADCHPGVADTTARTHVPARAGLCTACHDPHGTNNPRMLKAPAPELCYTCHPAMRDSVQSARVPHRALYVGSSCGNCHGAHRADAEALLRERPDSLCLSCHDREYPSARGRLGDLARQLRSARHVHAPVAAGICTSCHAPHGGRRARLLTGSYELDLYAEFRAANYALCLTCHQPEAVTARETDATGFRDGRRNLHVVHLSEPGRNRSCHTCHDPHAADNPKFIRPAVAFGAWMLPIGFRATASGGSCVSGCHEPRAYDRTASADTAAAVRPTGAP